MRRTRSFHRPTGQVLRTVGDAHEPRAFSTFAACAIALIGKLPDTIHDRAVVVDLKRRLPSEPVEAFRLDRTAHLDDLARKLVRWAQDHGGGLAEADPAMPPGIFNREADNWRPLLAIADAAGGAWPERARLAALRCHDGADDSDAERLVLLLGDIKAIFEDAADDRLASADLTKRLVELEGRPWAEYGRTGKPLSQNQLARLLKPLGIAPEVIRIRTETARGYMLVQFAEAFERYLSQEGAPNRNTATYSDGTGPSAPFQTVTPESDVTVENCKKPNNDGTCCDVTVAEGGNRDEAQDESAERGWVEL